MPWKYTEDYYREYTRTTWNETAHAYVDLMKTLAPFREEVVARLAVRPGERILDLGTGPGEPALTLAERTGAAGRVTGVDLSERMIALAQAAARVRGLTNVDFRVMDSSALSLPDAAFDAVVSCFGFQIFTDPEGAAREAHRVLVPGGRIAVAVWGPGERVPLLDAVVAPMLEHAEPDESGYLPTPYETGGPGEMVAFLAAAGFRDGGEIRLARTVTFDSPEAYLDAVLKATPLGHSLEEEPADVRKEVLRKARANLVPWTTSTGIALPAECVVVTARA